MTGDNKDRILLGGVIDDMSSFLDLQTWLVISTRNNEEYTTKVSDDFIDELQFGR